jgi:hypothetical protein
LADLKQANDGFEPFFPSSVPDNPRPKRIHETRSQNTHQDVQRPSWPGLNISPANTLCQNAASEGASDRREKSRISVEP